MTNETKSETTRGEPEAMASIGSVFAPAGILLDHADLAYNPCDDIIFPTIVATPGRLSDPADRYYMYYAPHDSPGGICLAHAPAISGPWTEHVGNPVIGRSWPPHYSVGHVSAPDALWVSAESRLFVYYHGDNDQTHYATSCDGVHFDYGGVAVDQTFYRDFAEDVYDRVFYGRVYEHEIAAKGSRYVFLFARSSDQGLHTQGIYLSWSDDARRWSRPVRLIERTAGARFICSPCLFSLNGRHYVAYHAELEGSEADPGAHTDIFVDEVDAELTGSVPLGTLLSHREFPGPNRRVSDPLLINEDGRIYLVMAIASRLNQIFALATADPSDLARALAARA